MEFNTGRRRIVSDWAKLTLLMKIICIVASSIKIHFHILLKGLWHLMYDGNEKGPNGPHTSFFNLHEIESNISL